MERFPVKIVVAGIASLILLIAVFAIINIETVAGNEVGVMETWSQGLDPNPYPAKTYFLWAFTQKMYKYPLNLQVFVMNDLPAATETGEGRDYDSYLVQSAEGQNMHISLNVQWRIDAEKVIEIHRTVRNNIEENLLRPVVMRIVKDAATEKTAIEAYSGSGLVDLQNKIHQKLASIDGELRQQGVIVENFVIEHIRLDENYVKEINDKQVAIQGKLKADEQTKYATAEALKAKAEAQADLNRKVVEAERDKQVGILTAEKNARQQVLAAEAEKEKLVLEATGNRDAALLKAEGILALGKSEAEAKRLQLLAYAVEGADVFVKIEVAKYLATAHQNVNGYLPSDMHIYTLGNNFMNAVDRIVSGVPMKPDQSKQSLTPFEP